MAACFDVEGLRSPCVGHSRPRADAEAQRRALAGRCVVIVRARSLEAGELGVVCVGPGHGDRGERGATVPEPGSSSCPASRVIDILTKSGISPRPPSEPCARPHGSHRTAPRRDP